MNFLSATVDALYIQKMVNALTEKYYSCKGKSTKKIVLQKSSLCGQAAFFLSEEEFFVPFWRNIIEKLCVPWPGGLE